jgi:arginyl-tRNA synthetase
MTDKFRKDIALSTSLAFKQLFPDLYNSEPELYIFNPDQLVMKLETPKDPLMGSLALPLFDLARQLKTNPAEINRKLVESQKSLIQENKEFSHLDFNAVGGFNNSRIKTTTIADYTISSILAEHDKYGSSAIGSGKVIVIDFSSPNIAKPFGIQHLRSTAIGNSLYRVYQKLGYKVVGINHLGDWGTQFGKMIVAYKKWGDEQQLKDEPIKALLNLYVRFHKEEESNPSLSDEAREAFRKMEEGDPEALSLWQKFKDLSLTEFERIYQMMDVHFDYYTGESFYNDKMEPIIERLRKAGLTSISEGALIVPLDMYDLPACLLRRADGATLYATRDLAGFIYRSENYDFAKALYVVNIGQRDHFRQVFKVIELLEEAEKIPIDKRISSRLIHVDFGWIKLKDEVMSTRGGNIIFLEDVFNKAIALAKEKIIDKNPELKNIEATARQIGLGAVVFADLSTRKEKDVNFDWDKALNFEGETGPYLQYTHARLSSLLRHYSREIPSNVNYALLDFPEECRVLELLYRFPRIIEETAGIYDPYLISAYLLDVASAFNKVYQRKDAEGRIDKIVSDNVELTDVRMALVSSVRVVIKEGLYLLGIEAPEEM